MRIDRRTLLVSTAALAAASTTRVAEATTTPRAKFKLSSQEPIIPGSSLTEKLDNMEKWGFDGIEFWGGYAVDKKADIQKALAGRKIKISAVCAGYQGVIMSDQESERNKFMDSIKPILAAAGELGATGVVMVPAFNGQTKLDFIEGRKLLIDMLHQVGAYAESVKSRVLLEPLDRYEAWFMRQLSDTSNIVREVNSPGVRMMGDMYHMGIEETSDEGAFLSGGEYVHHVHLASYKRNLPGQDNRDFRNGFKGLKAINYQDFCSLECGVVGDKMVEIPKAVKFLRKQWDQA